MKLINLSARIFFQLVMILLIPSLLLADDCVIGELIIDDHPCEEGMFNVYLSFEHGNTSEYFHVYANNIYFGAFEYGDLPLDLGPLEGDGETVYNFHVIDGEDASCHRWKPFGPINCEGGGECFIGDLNVDFLECDDDGYYWVAMNFEYENVSEEGFKFFLNDELFGVYGYEELPIEVGPLAGDGETQYDFFVRDIVYEGCNNWRWVGPEECENWGGGECNIWDVVSEVLPCDGDHFNVMLDFEFENVGDEGFQVVGNGNNYGLFEYEALPITIGPLEGDGTTVYEFLAKDLVYEGCSDWTEIEPVDCGELGVNNLIHKNDIKLYPNPAGESLILELPDWAENGYTVHIYDNFGRIHDNLEDQNQLRLIFDLTNYPKGTFFVKIQFNGEKSIVKSFVRK